VSIWPSLWITFAIQVLASLVLHVPPVVAPVAQADLGVPASFVGFVTAAVFATAILGALLSAAPIARHGALRASQASLVLCGAGLAVMASASVWLILPAALVIGLGYGAVTPASSVILNDRVPPNLRAFIFSLKQTGVPVGGALAGALIPGLMAVAGWRWAAIVVALACIALALVLEWPRRGLDTRRAEQVTPSGISGLQALRLVMHEPRLRELALASFTYSGMQNCLASFLVVYLHERAGFGVGAAGLALTVAMAAGIAGRLLWGVAADRYVNPRHLLGVLGVAMAAAAFLTAALGPAWPMPGVLAVLLIFGLTAVGWNGVYISEAARIGARMHAGAVTGAAFAFTYAGVVSFPLLFLGVVQGTGSFGLAYAMVGTLALWRGAVLLRPVGHSMGKA
jgi:MFS family permease